MDTLGGRVRGLRTTKGLNQAALAKKSGVAQSTIAELETGTNKGKKTAARTLSKLAAALGTNANYLMTGRDSPLEAEIPTVEESELLAIYRELEKHGRGASLIGAARGMLDALNAKPSKTRPFSKV
jgi:transcriptional regulator with XRE-family HTH domain